MIEHKFQVKLDSGVIGLLKTYMKSKELIGRRVMILANIDGLDVYKTGTVAHVFEQGELPV